MAGTEVGPGWLGRSVEAPSLLLVRKYSSIRTSPSWGLSSPILHGEDWARVPSRRIQCCLTDVWGDSRGMCAGGPGWGVCAGGPG